MGGTKDALKDMERVLSLVATVLWAIVTAANLYRAFNPGAVLGDVLGLPIALPSLQIEQVGTYILSVAYRIFQYVLAFVVIVAGMQAALGIVRNFLITFLPIRIPTGTLNDLIRAVLGLLIIKAIVDATLRYFGFPMAQLTLSVLMADMASWPFITSAIVGAILGALLARRLARRREGEKVFEL